MGSFSPNANESGSSDHVQKAWALAESIFEGTQTLDDIEASILNKGEDTLTRRIDRMADQWTAINEGDNKTRLKSLFEALAAEAGDMQAFEALVSSELGGFVITAHPTFSLSADATDKARGLISGKANGETVAETGEALSLKPTASPTLVEEGEAAAEAVRNIRLAIRTAVSIFFDVAYEKFGAAAYDITPEFMTVASWVGFDLDGRTDIGWAQSLLFRYDIALEGIASLTSFWKTIDADGALEGSADVKTGLHVFRESFTLGRKKLLDVIEQGDHGDGLAALNRLVIENRLNKEAAMVQIDAALAGMLKNLEGTDKCVQIATYRAEWLLLGLGQSHIHFRLNAVQLHNAIKPLIEMDKAPDRSASRRHYLAAVSKLLDKVEPVNVHYGTLDKEQTTARRLFMLAAQFEKHFDGRTPIRLLVAESDTPFTLLTALYYARQFNVDDHVEISPLFETGIGLQRGDRVIAELLDNKHFLAYIKNQKRFCVQLGFSDSGRYIGQPAANLAIERFKLRLVKLWKKRGLDDVQLLFFDTHGESIGRGAHPGSLKHRFTYTHTPAVRAALNALDAPYKHEVSFQGGDGYLWFLSENSALATLTDFLDVRLGWKRGPDDPFYDNSHWSLDFFLTLKEYQDHVLEHPGYVELLDSFGPRLLYPTGSRAAKRQGPGGTIDRLTSVSQVRAIPNNAMLQQLGYMANTVSGFGAAIELAPDIFQNQLESSKRLGMLVSLVKSAARKSDIHVLNGYAEVMQPDFWLEKSEDCSDPALRESLRVLSKTLETTSDFDDVGQIVRKLRRDAGYFKDHLNGQIAMDPRLKALHEMRLALVQFIYLKATEIPRFSARQDISLEEILVRLLHMDVTDAVAVLRDIFPIGTDVASDQAFGEDATFVDAGDKGYERVHQTIFDPIEKAYGLILEISALIAAEIGAFG